MSVTITATKEEPVHDYAKNRAINKQGFGSKIPTDKMVQISNGNRWYRVYDSFIANFDPNGVFNYSYIIRKGREVRLNNQ